MDDDSAWDRLYDHYGKFIYFILREMNVGANDLDDIAQNVLVELMTNLRSYDRSKGRFRTWFRRVIRNVAITHFRKSKSQARRIEGLIGNMSEDETFQESDIDEMIEREWKKYITSAAMDRVSKSYQGKAIEAFELGLQGKSAAEISHITGLKENSVYTLRKRVKKSLLFEIKSLTEDLENENAAV